MFIDCKIISFTKSYRNTIKYNSNNNTQKANEIKQYKDEMNVLYMGIWLGKNIIEAITLILSIQTRERT